MILRNRRSIAVVLATILAGSIGTAEAGYHLRDSTDKAVADKKGNKGLFDKKFTQNEERGVKCTSGAKEEKGFGRQCEGGVKKTLDVSMAADGLADDLASEIGRMLADMMPTERGLRPTDDTMAEPPSWDECTEEGDCHKTIEFGGFAKLFWGCKMTFTKEDDEFRREIECGGKSFEGMGKKEYADIYEAV